MRSRFIKAFTLVEMLVALAVSSIIIGATYSSYEMVATQYKKNMDIADMHTSGRAIMRIIERDIRMAGFEYRDKDAKVTYGAISSPLTFKDSGNKCCDEITVTYDYYDEEARKAERIRIRYWTEAYTSNKGSRYRLYKQKDILGQGKKILAKPKLGNKEVMADYIEDLQFDIEMTQAVLGAEALWAMTQQLLRDIHAAQEVYKAKNGKYFSTRSCTRWSGRGGCTNKFGKYASGWGGYDNDNVNPALFGNNNKVMDMKSSRGEQNWNVQINSYRGGYFAYVTWWGAAEDYCAGYNPVTSNFANNPALKKTTLMTGELRKPPNHSICACHNSYRNNCNRRAWIDSFSNGRITVAQSNWWNSNPKGHGPYADAVSPGAISSSVVGINLTLRTRNEYGKDRQFKKKDYHAGNYKLDKTDKYKRDTFSSTVLVRNLAL